MLIDVHNLSGSYLSVAVDHNLPGSYLLVTDEHDFHNHMLDFVQLMEIGSLMHLK
jgi:hypothetical protein